MSTQTPHRILPYHYKIEEIIPALPMPYDAGPNWVKGDMVISVGFHRLDFFRYGKDAGGKRVYRYETLPDLDIKNIRACILSSLGLSTLTKHLP
jgi:mRNA interferase MazF